MDLHAICSGAYETARRPTPNRLCPPAPEDAHGTCHARDKSEGNGPDRAIWRPPQIGSHALISWLVVTLKIIRVLSVLLFFSMHTSQRRRDRFSVKCRIAHKSQVLFEFEKLRVASLFSVQRRLEGARPSVTLYMPSQHRNSGSWHALPSPTPTTEFRLQMRYLTFI